MPQYQTVQIALTGGLNEDDNPTVLSDTDLVIANNVYHQGSVIHTRPGIVVDPDGDYANEISATRAIQGMYEFRKEFGGSRTFMIVHNGNVYKDDTPTAYAKGTVTITDPGSGAAGKPWTLAQHQNTVYGAGGAPADNFWAAADPSGTPTLAEINMLDTASAAVTPKVVFEKWNRLFVAQFYDDNSSTVSVNSAANPLVVRYPDLGTDYTAAASWHTDNTIGGPGIGGLPGNWSNWITGFGEYTDNRGDWLLILTRRAIYSVRQTGSAIAPFVVTDAIANGCAHQRAFVSLGIDSGDGIYLSEVGVHSVRQSQQHGNRANRFLSWPIRKTFDTLNRDALDQVSGGYWPAEGVVLFAVPVGSDSTNSLILAMDIKQTTEGRGGGATQGSITADSVRWFTWTLTGESPSMIAPIRDSSGEVFLYVGTYTGDVAQFQKTTFSDLGSAYTTQFQTKHMDFGALGREKQVADAWLKMQPGGSYTPEITVAFDYGSKPGPTRPIGMPKTTSTWGPTGNLQWTSGFWSQSAETFQSKVNLEGSGETVGFSFQHSGALEPFGVAHMAVEIGGLGDDTEGTAT